LFRQIFKIAPFITLYLLNPVGAALIHADGRTDERTQYQPDNILQDESPFMAFWCGGQQ